MDGLKEYGRFDGYDAMPPEKNGDYAWLLHIIKSMKNGTGKAAVILPHGVLFRGNAEESIRKNIIDRHLIKGIIGLPANLFYGTGIPACIIVLDKENTASRTGIFMIDASHGFTKDGDKNRLREQDIYKIVTTFNAMTEIPGFSRFVPFDDIINKNSYNLNIPRYIDSSEKEDIQSTDSNKEIILQLSENILEQFASLKLLDKYDVYQVLLSYWNETMNDDVLLVIQDELGYDLVKVTDDIFEEPKESKKKKKDSAKEEKKKEPKKIGWEGRLIPKQIVLDTFFTAEQKTIEEKEEQLSQTESQFEEFTESNSDEEGYLADYIGDDEKIDSKKIAFRVKVLTKEKKTETEEYKILNQFTEYEASIKFQKKTVADLKKTLDENCRQRYSTFTTDEIKDLLVNRKWYKTLDDGIQNLYITVANHLTKRIVELYERYENTMPELTTQLASLEEEVAKHLEEMGFKL